MKNINFKIEYERLRNFQVLRVQKLSQATLKIKKKILNITEKIADLLVKSTI